MRSHRLFQAVSASVILAELAAAVLLYTNLIRHQRAEIQRSTQAEARQIAIRLQSGLLASIEPLERLGQWWISQGKPFDKEAWRNDAMPSLSRSRGLREAAWVGPDGYRQWLAVPATDPNFNKTRPDERIAQLVRVGKARRSMVSSEIFAAPAASPAFYICVPILKDKHIAGYVVGLYDVPSMISPLSVSSVATDHHYTVESGGRRLYGTTSENARGEVSAISSFEIGQQTWTVSLGVPLSYFREFRFLTLTLAGAFGALIYSFATLLYVSQRRSLELQRANAEVHALNRELNLTVSNFQTLLDVTPIGIAVANDPECRDIRTNPALANILGVPLGVDISKSHSGAGQVTWRMTRDGIELRPEELPMQKAAATGKPILGEEAQIERADGTVKDILSFAAPVFDEDGRVRGVIDACVDVTEQKKQEGLRRELEQRLQRANRMKSLGIMAAGIAHDFNNLLTSIIGHASLAMEHVHGVTELQRHIPASLESANQAAKLVRQILAYTGQCFPKLRPIDIGQVVSDLHSHLVSLATPMAEIRVEIAPQIPQILADEDEIQLILRNLVLNAVEAAVNERITIDLRVGVCEISGEEGKPTNTADALPAGSYVRVEVRDSGSGMPPEIAEQAFDPFFSTKFLGRGLGLSEALGIMRAHNGAVRLVTAPDEGTSVILFFPTIQKLASRDHECDPPPA